mgnify:CR=1 FL=1
MKNIGFVLLLVVCECLLSSCSQKQDDTNFRAYLSQDLSEKGKAGVLITPLGQPEDYDFTFFNFKCPFKQ